MDESFEQQPLALQSLDQAKKGEYEHEGKEV
jgi:hypothetical protein